MHNGFVQIDGEKMSKSLGNFFTVHELLQEGHRGEAIRLALLSAHYRQPLDISRDAIKEAKEQLDRFYIALDKVRDVAPETDAGAAARRAGRARGRPQHADGALPLHEALTALNRATSDAERAHWKAALLADGQLLGLLWNDSEVWLRQIKIGVTLTIQTALEGVPQQ